MTWIWLRRGNMKKETKSILIATQYNAIGVNYVEAKVDDTQKNSK